MTIETVWYPHCCKATIIHNFYRDDQGRWDGSTYVKINKEEIIRKTKFELVDIFNGPAFEYEEMVAIAAVSDGQLITKEILEKDFGFTVFNEADNPGSDDGHVYMMHKLVITNIADDDDYHDDDYHHDDDEDEEY